MLRRTRFFLIALVSLAGISPWLFSRFFADDYWYRMQVTQAHGPGVRPLLLLSQMITSGEGARVGALPWWTDPGLRLTFFRPLSMLLWVIDDRLWGANAVGYHVTNLLLWALTLVAAGLLFRRLAPTPRAATLAFAIYAWADARSFAVGWISNRTALVPALFSILGLLAWDRYRRSNQKRWSLAATLAFAAALCAGETGLCGLALLAGYELLGVVPNASRKLHLTRLAPMLLLVAGYVTLYRAGGFGAAHSGLYLDPIANPVTWLAGAVARVPTLAAALLWGLPIDLWLIGGSSLRTAMALGSFVLLWATLPLLRSPIEKHRPVAALSLGAALALLPVASTPPTVRVLLLPGIGAALLLGTLLDDAIGSRFVRTLLWLRHLITAPLLLTATSVLLIRSFEADRRAILRSTWPPLVMATRVYLLNAPSLFLATSIRSYLEEADRPAPLSVTLLNATPYPATFAAEGADHYSLQLRCGHFLDGELERFYRDTPLPPGTVLSGPLRITSANQDRLEIERLSDPLPYLFMRWDGERYVLADYARPVEMEGISQGIGAVRLPAPRCP